jgi:hypothetical protein
MVPDRKGKERRSVQMDPHLVEKPAGDCDALLGWRWNFGLHSLEKRRRADKVVSARFCLAGWALIWRGAGPRLTAGTRPAQLERVVAACELGDLCPSGLHGTATEGHDECCVGRLR